MLLVVAICCLFLFFSDTNGASIQKLQIENGSRIYPESLIRVGMADGKEFFAERDAIFTWTEAKDYCESFDLKLASITSHVQAFMLNSSFDPITFNNIYWTSGRDALDFRQFVWDGENLQPESYLPLSRYVNQLTCLFYKSESGESFLATYQCTSPMRPLCATYWTPRTPSMLGVLTFCASPIDNLLE